MEVYKKIEDIFKSFPLKSEININNRQTTISSAIDLFSSIVLERIIARLINEFPDVNFENLNPQSSINDIFQLIVNNSDFKEENLNDQNFSSIQIEDIKLDLLENCSLNINSVGIDIESKNSIPNDIFLIKNSSLRKRLFSEKEIIYSITKPDPIITLTGIFAAKEAFIKALSSKKKIGFNQINIAYNPNGKPFVILNNNIFKAYLSISHTSQIATAICIC